MNYLEKHRNEIFKKINTNDILKEIESYKQGKGKLQKTLNHFFEECIFECQAPRGNKSPMDALKNQDDINFILNYISTKPNFYTGNEIANVKTFFRNAGRLAQKVANFCPKNARDIYFRYHDIKNTSGGGYNILDTSMGFGSRMSAVLLSGHSYCGFDPNINLFHKLKEYKQFMIENKLLSKEQKCGLYCCGSEVFKKELVDKFDISFTSPPYFNLEKYNNDDSQSTNNYDNYINWLTLFARPTIENTYNYLKVGGYAMINIKNLTRGKKEPLFDDFLEIFHSIDGFEFVEIFEINHQSKKNYTMNCNYDKEKYQGFKEPVMVFRKVF